MPMAPAVRKSRKQSFIRGLGHKPHIVMGDGGDDAGGAGRGGGHNAPSSRIFFIHGHGKGVHPIHGSKWIGTPTIKPTWQDPLGDETSLHALLHYFPDAPDVSTNFLFTSPSLLVLKSNLPNRSRVFVAEVKQLVRTGKWIRHRLGRSGISSFTLP